MAPRGPLPNVIIAGISRSGTTTVFDVLATHPDICVSSTKETRFFQSVRYGEPLGLLDSYRAF
ncbi:MAG: sulfotransferase, partial [Frankiales bacterium]|nr:sulfotransferase [Frankiales bacterium]